MEIRIRTPAKINLFLDILNRRQDGYHELISLVQLVSLYDTISIRTVEKKNVCDIEGAPEISYRENSIRKAIEAFRELTGFDTGVKVRLSKTIPIGGGLGGESSDAAAALKAMCLLAADKVSQKSMSESAAALGSDVPLFLGSTASIITGKGDIIHPIPPRVDYGVVLIYPGFSVDTCLAYRWYDSWRQNETGVVHTIPVGHSELEAMYCGDIGGWRLKNSFESVISEKYPRIIQAEDDLLGFGASYAGITGSGSSIIGVFKDKSDAGAAVAGLFSRYPFVSVLSPLEKQIEPVLKLV